MRPLLNGFVVHMRLAATDTDDLLFIITSVVAKRRVRVDEMDDENVSNGNCENSHVNTISEERFFCGSTSETAVTIVQGGSCTSSLSPVSY